MQVTGIKKLAYTFVLFDQALDRWLVIETFQSWSTNVADVSVNTEN